MTIQTNDLTTLKNAGITLDGGKITVQGILCVGNSSFIVVSASNNEIQIPIVDDTLLDRLLNSVPLYIGGEYMYRVHAQLVGTIDLARTDIEIKSVDSALITTSDGERFTLDTPYEYN